jgi:integrase/recombinase XerD
MSEAFSGSAARSFAHALKPPQKWVGSHLLRHSLATDMLRKGASLDEIGDVLRHRSRMTTTIYAKYDIEALRSIAHPWPVGGDAR